MEGGMTLEKLRVIIEAYTKPYKDEMDKIRQKTAAVTAQVERETAKIRNAYKKVAAATAGILSVAGVVTFGKSCVELGSDLQEVQNVVDVTFGDMNRQVDAFAKNSIKQYGLSELAAKEYMGTYGSMAKSFGFASEEVYGLSAAITGLTGDLASFRNLTTDEAYTKLKSIFTGETESLKEIGVVMTQTALDQYALNEGLGKTTANMTEQEKVMLRYRFVMSALSDAQGDFARTSGSWANKVRVLNLQFESLKATIGQGLINAFTPAIQVINTAIAKLQTLASYFRAFTIALFGDAGGGASASMESVAGSSGAVADNMNAASGAAKKLKEYTLGIDELNVLRTNETGGSGGVGGGALDFGSMSGELFSEVTVNPEIEEATERIREAVERLREAAGPSNEALKRLWDEGLTMLGNFSWEALGDFWDYFLVPLGTWTLGEGFPRFVDITNEFLSSINWDEINDSLEEFWKALEPFAENVGEGLLWFYENVLTPLAAYVINQSVPMLLGLLTEGLEDLNVCIEFVQPAFKWLEEKMTWFRELMSGQPLISEWVSQTAVNNLYGSIGGLKEIKLFADAMSKWKGLETWYNEEILPYLDENEWISLWNIIPLSMAYMWKELKMQWGQEIGQWWSNQVEVWFTEGKWETLYSTIYSELMSAFYRADAGWALSISQWWIENVEPWFTLQEWSELFNIIGKTLYEEWEQTKEEWRTGIEDWWNGDVSTWFTLQKWMEMMANVPKAFGEIFRGAVNAAVRQLNKLIDWANRKLNIDFDGFDLFGKEIVPSFNFQLFTLPHIPEFASGGIASPGQLFIANEDGPELVGRYGSRSGVMNNDQIVSAVSEGVATAVANVMATFDNTDGSNQPIELIVNLDGRTVSKSVHKAERRGGFKFRPT